jgi:quercetin dioxygenase-like cupin family protein
MSDFTIVHLDDFERPFPKWALARKSLGVTSFGMNVVELPPGEAIPEHHELDRDHEEVFITLDGEATMVIDGTDHPAPTGTFVRLDPGPVRTIRNDGSETATILIVSAPRSSGYEPMDWA